MVGKSSLLFVGDSKMSALETRGYIQRGRDYYLTPLARVGRNGDEILKWVKEAIEGKYAMKKIYHPDKEELVAAGYELPREQVVEVEGEEVKWKERVIVVRSVSFASVGIRRLKERIEKAEEKLRSLTPPKGRGRKRWDNLNRLRDAVEEIISSLPGRRAYRSKLPA